MGLFSSLTGLIGGSGNDASAPFEQISAPDVDKMRLQLEEYVLQGLITPEQAEVVLQNPSALEQITTDPQLVEAQMSSLSKLQEIADQGGLTATDRARLNDIQRQEAQRERSQREAIIQNAAQRGIGGSGIELLGQMMNQQESASRQSARDMDVAALAEQRALEALIQSGNMAGNIRSQDFGEQARVAEAKDQIERFNAANRQGVLNQNVDRRNDAQQFNLNRRQNVADQNTDLRNKQQGFNKGLYQQDFNNRMDMARAKSGAAQSDRNYKQGMYDNIEEGAMDIASAAFGFSDRDLKTNVKEFDASGFLDEITGYKYRYKNPKHGSGEKIGVMAQDVEKEAPQAVVDTKEGKMLDYAELQGPILASLANLHDRLKKVED